MNEFARGGGGYRVSESPGAVFDRTGKPGAPPRAQLRERLPLTTPSREAHGTGSREPVLAEPGRQQFLPQCEDTGPRVCRVRACSGRGKALSLGADPPLHWSHLAVSPALLGDEGHAPRSVGRLPCGYDGDTVHTSGWVWGSLRPWCSAAWPPWGVGMVSAVTSAAGGVG